MGIRGAAKKPRTATGYSIMVYCGDVLGLGHLRRNTAIVSRLVQDCPGSNALLVTSLPTGNLFEAPPGVDVITLPSLTKRNGGQLQARRLTLERKSILSIRTSIIEGVARSFEPDLLLVDHQPTGVWDELLPTLERLRGLGRPPCTVLGLRDILDDPSATIHRWGEEGTYRNVEQFYDSVLVYGAREVFDTAREYRLEHELTTEIEHCGYVCAETTVREAQPSRRELGIGDGKLVVITAGGGADGFPMMKLGIDAIRRMDPTPGLEVVCITGPLMSRDEIDELRHRALGLPVHVLWCVERAPVYFAAADVIVTMAGYNTLIEAIRLKKKTLVLPRLGPSAEQSKRAELFSRLGVVRGVGEEERTPEALSRLISATLNSEILPGRLPGMDGLDQAVSRLKSLLERRRARLRVGDREGQ